MPIREYTCLKCKYHFEVLEGMDERTLECEKCGNEVKSHIGAPALVFKGAGFYCTEYGNKPQWLEPKEQAQRASRECKEAGLQVAKPQKYSEAEGEKLKGKKPLYFY